MIETERLLLRQWRDADREPYAALNAEAEVMAHFPAPFTSAQSDAALDRHMASLARHGWGNWAVERRADGMLLGHIGVKPTGPDLPFGGAHEIGWRLARHAWGCGYASEGARAALVYAFDALGLLEIVSFTARGNIRSEAVMRRIGMHRAPERDFDHPDVPEGHRLRRHIVYALERDRA